MSTLNIKNLSVVTADKTAVVNGASLTVKLGEVHVIMGRNGSGKSSLVNAIMGHPKYTVTGGNVTLGKQDILRLTPEERARAGLFLSLQHVPHIDGITLAYFMHKVHSSLTGTTMPIMDFYAQAVGIATELGISESLLRRPLNAGLSGGEKKQSEILQLHLAQPTFAFLDEVDSGMDITTMKKVFKSLNQLKKAGTALVLITHYPDILKRLQPDVVHVMSGGTIVETGGAELVKQVARHGF